ncbi:MAG: hypothetical protein ACOC8F_06580, partial [Planctomycetota bacterium]
MKRPRKLRIRLARRWAQLTRRQRLGGVALVVLVVAAGVWLVVADGGGADMVPLTDRPLTPEQRDRAAAVLDAQGIPYRRGDAALLVAPDQRARARAALASASPQADPVEPLRRLAEGGDIWSSAARKTQRWRATKMLTLGRLISRMDAVASATVLFEPGVPRRLGAAGVAPTAVVNVTLAPGAEMTDALAAAIADQVAGSIEDMDRQAVRIVDSAGRSYRAAAEGALAAAPVELQRAETRYERKIRSALSYIDGLAVAAHVERVDGRVRCTGASVSVPRSYLGRVAPAGGAHARAGQSVDAVRLRQSEAIRRCVQRAIGADSPEAVAVHWYADRSDAVAPAPPATAARRGGSDAPALAAGGAVALLTGLVAWGVLRRRRTSAPAAG